MIQLILVAHGKLATEMKNSAEMLCGTLANVYALNFEESEGLASLSEKIYQQMKALQYPVLIFTDLFGGTPYNASCSLLLKYPDLDAEVVSGMSLPLVLELVSMLDRPLKEVVSELPLLATEVVKVFDKNLIDGKEDL